MSSIEIIGKEDGDCRGIRGEKKNFEKAIERNQRVTEWDYL